MALLTVLLTVLLAATTGCTGNEHTVLWTLDVPEGTSRNRDGQAGGAGPAPARPPPARQTDAGQELDSEPPPVPPATELDPTASFDWAQTLPGRGTCRAGVYVGTFQCVTDGLPVLITGQVSLALAGSVEAQLLTVIDGRVGDLAGELFDAGVRGELNCLERQFHGTTTNGVAHTVPRGATPLPFAPAFQGFEAAMFGTFNDQELVIGGTWILYYELGGRCIGTWQVSAQP